MEDAIRKKLDLVTAQADDYFWYTSVGLTQRRPNPGFPFSQ